MPVVQKIAVVVEQRHIDAGARFNSSGCPIALAAREQGLKSACLNASTGRLKMFATKGYSTRYVCVDAGQWGNRFDLGKPVRPQAFVFEAPAPAGGA